MPLSVHMTIFLLVYLTSTLSSFCYSGLTAILPNIIKLNDSLPLEHEVSIKSIRIGLVNNQDQGAISKTNFTNSFTNITSHIQSQLMQIIGAVSTKTSIMYQQTVTMFTQNILNSANQLRQVRELSHVRVSYINGIYHTQQECLDITKQLEGIFNTKVRPFYLPSSGSWAKDVTVAGYALFSKSQDIAIAKNLSTHLKTLLNEIAPRGRVLHIAHSAGAIITYLAAKYHLSNAEKSRIDVITFGGGHSITRKYFPGRLVNYYSNNDPLVMIDSRAGHLFRAGTSSVRSWVSWLFGNSTSAASRVNRSKIPNNVGVTKMTDSKNSSKFTLQMSTQSNNNSIVEKLVASIDEEMHVEVRDRKHNTSFIFLAGKARHPIRDHSLDGPTYLAALRQEAKSFHRMFQELVKYEAHQSSVLRHTRKSIARVTGIHHFWTRGLSWNNASNTNTNRSFLRTLRKAASRWSGMSHFWSLTFNQRMVGSNTSSYMVDLLGIELSSTNISVVKVVHDTPEIRATAVQFSKESST